jgi:hypothetical protein
VGGHACQGLFVHVFLVQPGADSTSSFRFPAGVHERRRAELGGHRAHHFVSGAKPWRGPSRCANYFEFLQGFDDAGMEGSAASCVRMLREKRACLQPRLSADACRACRRKKLAHYPNRTANARSSRREAYTCMAEVPTFDASHKETCPGTTVWIL